MNFWKWLKELFNIDFTNKGKHPYGEGYDSQGNYIGDEGSESSDSGVFGGGSFSSFGNLIQALVSRLTGAALTPAERESSALQLSNQQTLNEEDYQRKIDFYERYESPQAMMQQYKAAGLNPALMYGGAPSISASGGVGTGSAAMPSAQMESIAGMISAISGASLRSQQQRFDMKMREKELELEGERLGIQRNQSEAYAEWLRSQKLGQDITNVNLQRQFDLNADNVSANTRSLLDGLKSNEVQRELMRAHISESKARIELTHWNAVIAKADASVRSKYNTLMVRQSELMAEIMTAQSEYERKLLQNQFEAGVYEVANLITQNDLLGLDRDYYEGNRNWDHALGVARVVTTAGAAAAGAALGLKKSPSTVNLYGPQSAPSWLNPHPYYGPIVQ